MTTDELDALRIVSIHAPLRREERHGYCNDGLLFAFVSIHAPLRREERRSRKL